MTSQRHYQRERQRRIDTILAGGQGRTPPTLRRDAAGVAWTLALVVMVAALLAARACAGGAP